MNYINRNIIDLIRWQLQLLLLDKASVSELYLDMKDEDNNLFHLSTLSRFLRNGKISKENLMKIEEYLEKALTYKKILPLFFAKHEDKVEFDINQPFASRARRLVVKLFNNPDILEILCYKLSREIKSSLKRFKMQVDYILTFPEVLPLASVLGPKYLNIPFIPLIPYRLRNEECISVDYIVETEIVRTYYLAKNDVQPKKSYGVILDYIEFGYLGKVFWDLIRKQEIQGEIKFIIIVVSIGKAWKNIDDIDEIQKYILYTLDTNNFSNNLKPKRIT